MNYKYNQFKHGQKVTFEKGGQKREGIIKKDHVGIWIVEKGASEWSFLIKGENFIDGSLGVNKLKLVDRTIEDVQEGDLIKDRSGDFCRVLGVVGKVVFMSYTWSKDEDEIEKYGLGYSISELKDYGYTIVDEETPKETITIAGHTYSKKEVEERLEGLEEV